MSNTKTKFTPGQMVTEKQTADTLNLISGHVWQEYDSGNALAIFKYEAAPEMYEALAFIEQTVSKLDPKMLDGFSWKQLNKVRAALAKARGAS